MLSTVGFFFFFFLGYSHVELIWLVSPRNYYESVKLNRGCYCVVLNELNDFRWRSASCLYHEKHLVYDFVGDTDIHCSRHYKLCYVWKRKDIPCIILLHSSQSLNLTA